jgi:RNA polymerase sigma-70 factor, ECF subfamily
MARINLSPTAMERMQLQEKHLRNLFVQALAGDQVLYHTFLSELSAHLRAFFKRRLTNLPDEVEDLVQDTLLAIHNQRHTYQSDLPLTAWVHAVARHKFVDLWRRRAARDDLHDSLDDELDIFAANETRAQEARRDVMKLLMQIPEKQRFAIEYMKLQGFSAAQTAQATGMSESAVKVAVHRGLKALSALILKTRSSR